MSLYRIDIRIDDRWTIGLPMEMTQAIAEGAFATIIRSHVDEAILRDGDGQMLKRYPEDNRKMSTTEQQY